MTIAADPTTHLFWITSRAAGTTALLMSSASVSFGLLMGGKLIKSGAADRRPIHEILSLSVMVALAVHGLSLIGDKYLHPGLLDVTVPFASSYKPAWTSLGIVCGWALTFLGLSYYVRDRISRSRWKLIHRFTLLAWFGGIVHNFTECTDAGETWFLAVVAATTAPVLAALALRVRTTSALRNRPASPEQRLRLPREA